MAPPVKTAGRAIALACAALAFACGTAGLIRQIAGPRGEPEIPFLTEKLDYWSRDGEGFTTLICGTSIVLRGVEPRILDEELRRLGRSSRSFNASLPGLAAADQGFVLDRFLATAPASLTWVIVEPALRVRLRYENVTADRVVAVHAPGALPGLLRLLWSAGLGPIEMLSSAANHALATSYHLVGAGVLARIALPRRRAPLDLGLAEHRGFSALDDFSLEHVQRRHAFQELLRVEAAGLLEPEDDAPERLSAPQLRHLRALARRVGDGAELGWLVMPNYGRSRSRAVRDAHAQGALPGALFDLDDPAVHPDAKDPDFYWDRRHLNARGAREASIRLARLLAEVP